MITYMQAQQALTHMPRHANTRAYRHTALHHLQPVGPRLLPSLSLHTPQNGNALLH